MRWPKGASSSSLAHHKPATLLWKLLSGRWHPLHVVGRIKSLRLRQYVVHDPCGHISCSKLHPVKSLIIPITPYRLCTCCIIGPGKSIPMEYDWLDNLLHSCNSSILSLSATILIPENGLFLMPWFMHIDTMNILPSPVSTLWFICLVAIGKHIFFLAQRAHFNPLSIQHQPLC